MIVLLMSVFIVAIVSAIEARRQRDSLFFRFLNNTHQYINLTMKERREERRVNESSLY